MHQLCHAKRCPNRVTKVVAKVKVASEKIPQTVHGALWNLMNLRDKAESLQSKNHEDNIAGKGFTSMSHCNLVHKFISYTTGDENSGCKSGGGQGIEKARHDPSMEFRKSQEQKAGFCGSTNFKKKVHFASLMDTCHLKNAELGPKFQKTKKQRQNRTPRGQCKRRPWSPRSFC